MATEVTPALIAAKLAEKAEDYVTWLHPNGRRVGPDWCVGSVAGEEGNSCKICLEGDKRGRWADFSLGDKSGDLVDLLAAARNVGLGPALKEACEWLGIDRPQWAARKGKTYLEPERPKNARAVDKSPAVETWLATRRIAPETYARYKIVADGPDTAVFPSMRDGKLLHLKYRSVREKKFWASTGTEKCLFGWQGLNPHIRTVILTEGEMDCLAFAQYGLQSLSIPFGAGKGDKQDWIENEWQNLERFDTIFLALDQDDAGKQTVNELVERLGRFRCRVIDLPRKDINQCLMDGIPADEISRVIREAKTLDPAELRNAAQFTESVIERFYPPNKERQGFLAPWLSMAGDFTFEWGATTVIAGFAGHGKSTAAGQIVLDALRQDVRACVASLEFKSEKWLQWLVRQATSIPDPDRDLIRRSMSWLGNGLWAVDIYGGAKADRILDIFKYSHRRYGTKLWVIDNWSKLGIPDDDYREQKRVIEMLTEASVVHNVHTIVLNHLRKEDTDLAISQSGKLGIRGSAAIGDMVDNIFMWWRNRKKESEMKDLRFQQYTDEEQTKVKHAPDAIMNCEKARNHDHEPRLALHFNKPSHTFVERFNDPPYTYVKKPEVVKAAPAKPKRALIKAPLTQEIDDFLDGAAE